MRIVGLKKSFGLQTILEEGDYDFPEGERIGLVGANGAGKTTLLNMICGLEEPDDGRVLLPKERKLGYLPQTPNPSPLETVLQECQSGATDITTLAQRMHALDPKNLQEAEEYAEVEAQFKLLGGYELEAKAAAILAGLGFSDMTVNPQSLSGGWRMRLELARLFIKNPDYLILDEPTNHLDLPSLVWVEDYLQNFPGTLIFVSHERALLNRLATYTLHLSHGNLNAYKGNFDAFLQAHSQAQEQRQKQAAGLAQKRAHMEDFVARFGAKATKASQAQSRVKMIAKLRALEADLTPEASEASMQLKLPEPVRPPRQIVAIKEGEIGYDSSLAQGINLLCERGQKIAIIGANGIGKSTLLKTLIGQVKPLSGSFEINPQISFGYFAQDQLDEIRPESSVFENLLLDSNLGQKECRGLLGSLKFSGDTVDKKAGVLSGGEQSRLGLAKTLATAAPLLLLDEPTNHLDMSSVEILADAFAAFKGSLIFVSHDRSFIDSVCTHVFAMLADGRSMLFEGDLDSYARQARLAGFPNVLELNDTSPKAGEQKEKSSTYSQQKEAKRARDKLKRRLEQCERDMEKTRQGLSEAEENLASVSPTNHTALAEGGAHIEALKLKLEQLEESWLEISTALED